ncbi:regulatory LuxR family protein [Maribacter vaceletii]|uniref:Regulatory LuxR family protein n=1 Tax=Maribacter vaceletii TaxID=1206816 RepID=A0A495E739_9FLAO|nr:triple tyrosine motif-containing protein [Maribacter vaceletii]RKR12389.1 regulatory LuxR family protein [Maribacter vaceletii]
MKNKIFILLCFLACNCFSQELPPIQNFSAVTYGGANQNWSITQSKEKYIYVANNSGLLAFDGANWKLYASPNGSVIRSVKAINNRIYTGCYMEFGFWEKEDTGILKYNSISSNSDLTLVEDEQFWNITEYKDWILFQSLQQIYIYNTKDFSLNIIESPSKRAQIFRIGESIYFQKSGLGIFKIENGTSVLVTDSPIIKENLIIGIFLRDNKLMFLSENGIFYSLEEDNLKVWPTALDRLSTKVNVYSSLQLQDESIVVGTISNGIYHIDREGNLVNAINQQKGLNNNTVLSIFEDEEKNLWLALDNGLSVVNLSSPFKEYIDNIGSLGQVYSAIVKDDYLYLGTNQGVFYKHKNSDNDFEFMSSTKGQVWALRMVNGDLFCGHNNGTYQIKNKKAKLISSIPGTWDIKPFKDNPDLLLQGNYQGISVLKRNGNAWELRNKIEGFDIASRFFEWISDTKLVVNHENKGVFVLELDDDITKVVKITNQEPYGSGASLASFNGQIIYTTSDGMFSFNKTKDKFELDKALNDNFFERDAPPFGVLVSDSKNNRLWGFSNNSILSLTPAQLNDKHEVIEIPVPGYFRKNMGVYGFESITPLSKNNYLIGTSNGFVTLNLNKLKENEYKVAITGVKKNPGNLVAQAISLNANNELEFKENSIAFSYNVPEYDKYAEVNYQYQLSDEHNEWSAWSNKADASFENLPFGEYTFRVRARVNSLITNTVSKSFVIHRPWYFSYLAYAIYLLLFSAVVFLVHRYSKFYYKNQQELLLKENRKKIKRKEQKTKRKIIEIKNEKLKDEIESKNRELASSTMSIIKKNEFLNVLKSQLVNAETPQQIKMVIKTIDRNINNADDWRTFEQAFNNADKDFLKRIKEIHPELTSNDLRLCAYLRLNLSSKEIAPLLNISGRSVEVKRYRLRKKMGLEHEKSLSDYILSL